MASYDMMRKYLDSVKSGDFQTAAGFFSDDIKVHFAGWKDIQGKDQYAAAVGEMMGAVDSFQIEEHDLLVSDDHAVVLDTWHITKGDQDVRSNHVIIYHTDADKITDIWVIPEDQQQMAGLMP